MEPELKNRLFPFHQVKGEESLAKNGRLLVIGDVHGCIRELEKLIKVLKPEKNDRMIFLGDLINKGPDTKSVLNLARSLKGYSILGNHEYRLLKFYHSINSLQLRSYEKSTIESMDEEDWDYLKSMVLWLEQPKEGRVFCSWRIFARISVVHPTCQSGNSNSNDRQKGSSKKTR